MAAFLVVALENSQEALDNNFRLLVIYVFDQMTNFNQISISYVCVFVCVIHLPEQTT